jgi:hypothetical protein
MKTRQNGWSPAETEILNSIINDFDGSPSRAYEKHPDWKTKLTAKHSEGAVYAKLHVMKRGKKGPVIGVKTTPEAAMRSHGRLVVVENGDLQAISCPKCRHSFHVFQAP